MENTLREISFLAAAAIEIVLPLVLAFWVWKRFKVPWAIFFLGMIFFMVSLARIPLNDYLTALLSPYFMGRNLLLVSIAVPSLSAGIFEEGARALAFGVIIKKRNYEKSIMYGIGHGGGGESMLFVGAQVLLTFLLIRFAPQLLPQSVIGQYQQTVWYMPFIGALERIMAMAVHISLSVMVMHAFIKRRSFFIILAILFHSLFNFVAVFLWETKGIVIAQLAIFFFALSALGFLVLILRMDMKTKRRMP